MPPSVKDPGATLKAVAVPLVAFGLCVLASILFLFVTAAVSARWGAARTGNAMMVMLCADALLLLLSALVVFLLLGRWVSGLLWRLSICGLYLALSAGALLVLFGLSAVVLNR